MVAGVEAGRGVRRGQVHSNPRWEHTMVCFVMPSLGWEFRCVACESVFAQGSFHPETFNGFVTTAKSHQCVFILCEPGLAWGLLNKKCCENHLLSYALVLAVIIIMFWGFFLVPAGTF